MKLIAFSVFDKKIGAYMVPQFFRTKGEAVRAFIDACAGNDHFRKHAEDFVFMEVGSWEDSDGLFTSYDVTEPVFTALDAVQFEGRKSD